MSSASSHLSYPSPQSDPSTSTSLPQPPPQRETLKNRLYVGNLHPTVDECVPSLLAPDPEQGIMGPFSLPRYTLIQVFSKFGKLLRSDYLFHKTGALRGRPRGYAFVEYSNDQVSTLAHPLAARDEGIKKNKNIVLTPGLFLLLYIVFRLRVPHVSFSLRAYCRPGGSSLATNNGYE